MTMALEGIRVLDLARYAPGLYVSMYLADMGADVIRLEEAAVSGRRSGFTEEKVAYRDSSDVRAAAFNALERNKRRIAVNLKDEDGTAVFKKLAAQADVVLEGFRPGVTARLGIDYETCRALNPRIIYLSLTGYGQDGPYRLMAGHDVDYVAIGGALSLVGAKDGTPVIPGNLIADYAGGAQNAIIGVLTALVARQRTGRGQYVDVSMTDGVIGLMAQYTQEFFMTGKSPKPSATRYNGGTPYYNVYEAKDGRWLAVGAMEPWFFVNVCKLAGRPHLADRQFDQQRWPETEAALRQAFKTKTAQEWHDLMSQEDTCVVKIYTFDEVFADAQVRQRKMKLDLQHPQAGKVQQVGFPIKLSETPAAFRRFAGTKGQDTDAILGELGYDAAAIARMRKQGAVA
ncbi:MAG: CoA transferase [Dehalococcoidia bacterium]|nr:CoA transferase [Dehalococcoidia bacterium]